MTRFENRKVHVLYNRFQPDEEVGDNCAAGWAGLYRTPYGGWILREDVEGFVTGTEYRSKTDLLMAWTDVQDELGPSDGEPEEEDYVIETRGGWFVVTPMGEKFQEWDDMIAAIKRDMEERNFWPNVWLMSDHGNFQVVTLDA